MVFATVLLVPLYVDEAIVVVNKPTLLLSVPGRGPDKQDCVVTRLAIDYPGIREITGFLVPVGLVLGNIGFDAAGEESGGTPGAQSAIS